MHLAPGTRLGRYDIRSLLGAGGMGEVYLAHDTTLRRDVAIKVLPNDAARDRDRLRRFEQEAHAVSSLNHPNILTIHEIGVTAARCSSQPSWWRVRVCGIGWLGNASTSGRSSISACRSHRRWPPLMPLASSIATSSPKTSWSGKTGS